MHRISWKFQRGAHLCQRAGAGFRTTALDCLGNTPGKVPAKSFLISPGRGLWDTGELQERNDGVNTTECHF